MKSCMNCKYSEINKEGYFMSCNLPSKKRPCCSYDKWENDFEKEAEKHLNGYIYDSLVYRYKDAREKVALYEALSNQDNTSKCIQQANRDIMRFCQILNEAIGEHD